MNKNYGRPKKGETWKQTTYISNSERLVPVCVLVDNVPCAPGVKHLCKQGQRGIRWGVKALNRELDIRSMDTSEHTERDTATTFYNTER
jgi:hypothetical protein